MPEIVKEEIDQTVISLLQDAPVGNTSKLVFDSHLFTYCFTLECYEM